MGVVARRYIDFLILLIPTPLVSVPFCSSIPTFCSFFYVFRSCIYSNNNYYYDTKIVLSYTCTVPNSCTDIYIIEYIMI